MPRTTRDEKPPVDPPPADTHDELEGKCLTGLPADDEARLAQAADGSAQSLASRTEAELLGLMSSRLLAPSAARDAWAEMYRRHSRYVTTVVARASGDRFRDADAVADLVSDTFQAVF